MTTEITLKRIIEQDILVNASQMITELAKDPEGRYMEEILECCQGPDYSEAPEGYTVARVCSDPEEWSFANEDMSTLEEGFDTEEEAIRAAWEDSGDEPDEVEALQHWIVTDFLADELEAVGALVARDIMGFNAWGRTECGQSLTMDSDLRKVAANIQYRIDNA